MTYCQAGHEQHDRVLVNTEIGSMLVYDWGKYKDQPGLYCTGQDDVSRTLINEGVWGKFETELITSILKKGEGVMVDFGCHIGWYSTIALQLGYKVFGYDGDPENIVVAKKNAGKYKQNFITKNLWIDSNTKKEELGLPAGKIYFVKIDLEGNDRFAIDLLEDRLNDVQHLFVEISPVFNKSYPELVNKLAGAGFIVYRDNKLFDMNFSDDQFDLLFSRE